MKCCSACRQTKPLTEFSKDITRRDGAYPYCKGCKSLYKRRHPEDKSKVKLRRDKSENKKKKQEYDRKRWFSYAEYRMHVRDTTLRKTYGITLENYNYLLKLGEGKCNICGIKSNTSLHADHCHSTGMVRGLLCSECNLGLGKFKDNEVIMTKAIKYLICKGS